MLIFAVAALVGVVVGFVIGGRLSALGGVHLRAPVLAWGALGVQASLGLAPLLSLPDGVRFGLVATSYGMVGVWLVVSAVSQRAALRGAFGLLAAGWLLNLVVIIPNGGMPVSTAALGDSGAARGLDVEEGHLWKHVELSPSTFLPALGDVVAVPALRSAVSAGDLVMVVAVAVAVAAGMVRPKGSEAGTGEPPSVDQARQAVTLEAAGHQGEAGKAYLRL